MADEGLLVGSPATWERTALGKLCARGGGDIQTGPFGSQLHASDYVAAGIPSIMPMNIGDNRVVEDGIARITAEDAKRLSRYLVRKGDIVYSRRGDVERRALIREKEDGWLCGTGCLRVRFGEGDVDPLFASYYLGHPEVREWIVRHAHGATMPNLNTAILSALPFVRPPISEQLAIAHILGTLDDKIELNRRMNETLEAIARAIFKSWFVDFDPVRAKASGEPPESICRRLRLTPDLLALFPDRLVDSELGEIPEGWETITLGSIANVTKGKSYKSSELEPSKTALVTLKSFDRGGGYRLDGLKEYTGSFRSEQEVFAGELIVAYTDVTQAAEIVGKPALIVSDSRYEHLVISLDVAVVRPKRPEYRPFLYELMSEGAFQQHTRAHTTGTTVLHLAAGAVPGFGFAWPGEGLVEAYSALAQPLFEFIDSQVGESRSLESARDALLPKLLSGALRVPLEGAI